MDVSDDQDQKGKKARAGILLRVSSLAQEDGYSIPDQERDSRAYCQTMGYQLKQDHVWNDGAQHSFTLNRPGLQAAFDAMRRGEIQVLVVGRYDRFSRVQLQQAVAIYQIEQVYGGRVESADPKEQFGRDATGNLLRSVNAWRAEQELELIRSRTQGGRKSRVRSGKLIAAPHPLYGYCWADPTERRGKTRYIIDEESAPVVRRIFRAIAAGTPLMQIARELEHDHVPTPGMLCVQRGWLPPGRVPPQAQWMRQTVRRIADNPAYAGQFVAYRFKMTLENERDREGKLHLQRRTHVRAEDDPDRIVLPPDVCPPIVSHELWEHVQRQLIRNKQEAIRNAKEPTAYLLRGGYVVCGYCGRRMAAATIGSGTRSRPYKTYRCHVGHNLVINTCPGGRVQIFATKLDGMVWAAVEYLFTDPHRIRTILENRKQEEAAESQRASEQIAIEEGFLHQLERRVANATQLSLDAQDEETRSYWSTQVQQLLPQQRKQEAQLADIRRLHEHQQAATAYLDTIEAWAKELGSAISEATYEEKRYLLRGLKVRVTCYRADHDPHFTVEWDLAGLREVYHNLLPTMNDRDIAAFMITNSETDNTL